MGLSFNQRCLINAVGESSKTSNPHAALIHIDMKVDGKRVVAMVDTGATHTFVDDKVAAKYGLKMTKCPKYVQTVNAKAQAIVGMVFDVSMVAGEWNGKQNLMVMPLGDFEVILGADFVEEVSLCSLSSFGRSDGDE